MVTASKCVYSAGFFLTVSVESMLEVAKYCSKNNRTYCLNLSAPLLCQFFKDQMASVLPFTDIVFGNETEAASYAEVNNLFLHKQILKTEKRDLSIFSIFIFNVLILFVTQVSSLGITDVGEIVKKIAMLPKENGSTSRLVIITQGSDPVIVVQHGKVLKFPVDSLAKEAIFYINGAGDAFVGGFLAQFVLGKSIDVAVKCGTASRDLAAPCLRFVILLPRLIYPPCGGAF